MINNCFNYVGSKDRIFTLIDKNLDKSKSIFVDLFCGSGVVGINEVYNYSRIVLNDACWQVIETLKFLRDNDFTKVRNDIEKVVMKYGLSLNNKEGFLKLFGGSRPRCILRGNSDCFLRKMEISVFKIELRNRIHDNRKLSGEPSR